MYIRVNTALGDSFFLLIIELLHLADANVAREHLPFLHAISAKGRISHSLPASLNPVLHVNVIVIVAKRSTNSKEQRIHETIR